MFENWYNRVQSFRKIFVNDNTFWKIEPLEQIFSHDVFWAVVIEPSEKSFMGDDYA